MSIRKALDAQIAALTSERDEFKSAMVEYRHSVMGLDCERDALKEQNKKLWELAYPDGPSGDAGFSCKAYMKLEAEREALKKYGAHLWEVLKKYGKHADDCAMQEDCHNNTCSCGWSETRGYALYPDNAALRVEGEEKK